MSRTALLVIGAALCLLVSVPASAQEGVKSVDDAWVKAVKAGDVDAVVALYAPDAAYYPPDAMAFKGTDEIRKSYTEFLGAVTVTDATFESTYTTTGDISIGHGIATVTLTPKAGGGPQTMKVRVTEVAKKIDGKWRYVVDHASAPMPPPQ